eukprot:6157397-Pleurochrysis_carterae.AAC.1
MGPGAVWTPWRRVRTGGEGPPVHEEDVFELQVGVRQLQPVQVLDRLEAVGCDARDLEHGKSASPLV